MKTLTLTQPWATLVARGAKRIETRAWATHYRGPLAIHAAQGLSPVGGMAGLQALCCTEPFQTVLRGDEPAHLLDPRCFAMNLPRGKIVAICTLVDVIRIEPTPQLHQRRHHDRWDAWLVPPPQWDSAYAFGDYTPGRYAWLLGDVQAVSRPIPARGKQRLWTWTAAGDEEQGSQP